VDPDVDAGDKHGMVATRLIVRCVRRDVSEHVGATNGCGNKVTLTWPVSHLAKKI
jgi:hypothetical protein